MGLGGPKPKENWLSGFYSTHPSVTLALEHKLPSPGGKLVDLDIACYPKP